MRTSSSAPIMATTTRPRSCTRCASCVKAARSARRRRTRSCGRTPSGCTAYSFPRARGLPIRWLEEKPRAHRIFLFEAWVCAACCCRRSRSRSRALLRWRGWRAGREEILNRVVNETRSGRAGADVIEQSSLTLEMLHREGLLQKVESPAFPTLMPAALAPHREWTAVSLDYVVQAYNTNLVKKSELPQRWEDLLDAKWKGRLGIERYNAEWLLAVVGQMGGEEKGVALLKEIVRKNGVSVRKGYTLLTTLTASGEVPLALTVYSYMPEQLKKAGQPIDWFFLGGKAVASHDFVVTSNAMRNPVREVPLDLIDPGEVLDRYRKWDGLYDEIFVNQAR